MIKYRLHITQYVLKPCIRMEFKMSKSKPQDSFSNRLKIAMENKNISQIQLSNLLGINRGMISDYYNGKIIPKQDKVFKIAQALHVSPSWLLGFDTEMNSDSSPSQPQEIKAEDVFTFDGKKITGQEILDLINEKIKKAKQAK